MTLSGFFSSLSEARHEKALPNYPTGSTAQKNDSRLTTMLNGFIKAVLMHPILRNLEPVLAFTGLNDKDFRSFKASPGAKLTSVKPLEELVLWLRFKFQEYHYDARLRHQFARKAESEARQSAQLQRHKIDNVREKKQLTARNAQRDRQDTMNARATEQTERMAREKERYENQKNAKAIVFSDYGPDEATRTAAIEQREQEKLAFTLSTDGFQVATNAWTTHVAAWCAHRTSWSQENDPPGSIQLVHDWIFTNYGILAGQVSDDAVPESLRILSDKLTTMKSKAPTYLDDEGNKIDEDWNTLSQEREQSNLDRQLLKQEDRDWHAENKRFTLESHHVTEERKLRREKVAQVEKTMVILSKEVASCERSINTRRVWHEDLSRDYNAWASVQASRNNSSNNRVAAHKHRNESSKARIDTLNEQLASQKESTRVLAFDRTSFEQERKRGANVHEKDAITSDMVLSEAQTEAQMLPEIINRLETDLNIRNGELKLVNVSNKTTTFEGTTPDGRDSYMQGVKTRREDIQARLDAQRTDLEDEQDLVSSLIDQLKAHIVKLESEVEFAATEKELRKEFTAHLAEETRITGVEMSLRLEKKQRLKSILSESSEWVQDTLMSHSTRKQGEADRLVEQAQRAALLQQLVQRFTSRVIARESRVLKQKRRVMGSEHRIEMLETPKWFQFITLTSSDLHKQDLENVRKANAERESDIVDSMELQAQDQDNIKHVEHQLDASKATMQAIVTRREAWRTIEITYSTDELTHTYEDLVYTSQLRGLIGQLDDSFTLLKSRLTEENESLTQASTQLQAEVHSIQSFVTRMESEEDLLTRNEKESLKREEGLLTKESAIMDIKSQELTATYKTLQAEHGKLFERMMTIRKRRKESPGLGLARKGEIAYVKALLKAEDTDTSDPTRRLSFSRKFNVKSELSDLPEVLAYLDTTLSQDMTRVTTWKSQCKAHMTELDAIRGAFTETNWDHDILSRIPVTYEVTAKLKAKAPLNNREKWLADLIQMKKLLSDKDGESVAALDEVIRSIEAEDRSADMLKFELKKEQSYIDATSNIGSSSGSKKSPGKKREGGSGSSDFMAKYASGDLPKASGNVAPAPAPARQPAQARTLSPAPARTPSPTVARTPASAPTPARIPSPVRDQVPVSAAAQVPAKRASVKEPAKEKAGAILDISFVDDFLLSKPSSLVVKVAQSPTSEERFSNDSNDSIEM